MKTLKEQLLEYRKTATHIRTMPLPPIGSECWHWHYGNGTVCWINDNPNSQFPVKVHFHDYQCYLYINQLGEAYKGQNCSEAVRFLNFRG